MDRDKLKVMIKDLKNVVNALESEIICLVKDKNLKKKYKLTRAIVEEAFPDIQWGNRS